MAIEWVKEGNYEDIIYSTYNGIAKISINRPEVHNAFRPKTVMELINALHTLVMMQMLALSF